MKKKKTRKTKKIIKNNIKETSHEKWLEGYWKWRKQNSEYSTMANNQT